jgi:hypothetical protein
MINQKTGDIAYKLFVAICSFMIEAFILKWIWNSIGPDQGLREITWLAAMGWMMIGRGVLGTGAIKSAITDANRKKD